MKKTALLVFSCLALAILLIVTYIGEDSGTILVACDDGKVYEIATSTGEVVRTIGPLSDDIVLPQAIDYSDESEILYMGGSREEREDKKSLLIAVNLGIDDWEILEKHELSSEYDASLPAHLDRSGRKFSPWLGQIRVSPSGEYVYVGYVGYESIGFFTHVYDKGLKKTIRSLKIVVDKGAHFSRDETKISDIYPSGARTENGIKREWPGVVFVSDLLTGEIVSKEELVDNAGLYPPWREIDYPLLYVRRNPDLLEMYNREKGDLIYSINTKEKYGLYIVHEYPLFISAHNVFVVVMMSYDQEQEQEQEEFYVVALDSHDLSVKFKTKVGKNPTNVVRRARGRGT